MIYVNLIIYFVSKYVLLLFTFNVNGIFSITIGRINNTIYLGAFIDQSYSNITCNQCKCIALQSSAIGWNYIRNNYTCQLIKNYSTNDIGLRRQNNTIFLFQKIPPDPLSTTISSTSPTSTMKSSTTYISRTTTSSSSTLRSSTTSVSRTTTTSSSSSTMKSSTSSISRTTTKPTTTTSFSCSTSGRGNIDILSSLYPFPWTKRSYNYTAINSISTIVFGVNGNIFLSLYLDDISVIDNANPSIQLIKNSGFENSTTSLIGWNLWCSSSCSSGTQGGIISSSNCRSSNNCFKDECDNSGTDFLAQSFPTVVNHIYTISFYQQQIQNIYPNYYSITLYIDII